MEHAVSTGPLTDHEATNGKDFNRSDFDRLRGALRVSDGAQATCLEDLSHQATSACIWFPTSEVYAP